MYMLTIMVKDIKIYVLKNQYCDEKERIYSFMKKRAKDGESLAIKI